LLSHTSEGEELEGLGNPLDHHGNLIRIDGGQMVLYRVHSEPLLGKYYSAVCSKATLFQVVIYSLIIIPPFFIAYATNGRYILICAHHDMPFQA